MTDIIDLVGAVNREVGQRDHAGRPARFVVATRIYDTSVEDLWDAVTNPERIPRWFMPITGDLRLHGRYQLQGNAGGEITACERPHSFKATWEFGGDVTWIEVRLSDAPDGKAQLRLEHLAHVGDDRSARYGPGAVGVGWDLGLLGLSWHLSSGQAVKPEEGMAWVGSPDGIAFVHASSDDWCRAAIAAGDDAPAARGAAARTTAAYTGQPEIPGPA